MTHLKVKDLVEVTTGDNKGHRGTISRIDSKNGRVYVDGAKTQLRHVKPSKKSPRGGRIEKQAPIHISNVRLVEKSTPASSTAQS